LFLGFVDVGENVMDVQAERRLRPVVTLFWLEKLFQRDDLPVNRVILAKSAEAEFLKQTRGSIFEAA
jgi:hypothetical protein